MTSFSTSRLKIILAGFWEEQIRELSRSFPDVEFRVFEGHGFNEYDADAIIGAHRAVFDEIFQSGFVCRCHILKWVHAPAAGVETYLTPEIAVMPFTLTNEKTVQGPEVADHAVGLLLALTRSIGYVLRGVPRERMPRPVELRGKWALIIGCGGVGMSIAERVAGFGMHVSVVTETDIPYVSFVERRYMAGGLLEALPDADVIFIAAPLTPSTRGMVGRKALMAMKQTAYLINVSRGAIIDTEALVEVLEKGWLAGVGLDVTDPEPLPPNHPLCTYERVVITPHMAGMSDRLSERSFQLILTNLHRFVSGRPLLNIVDKILGF